MKADKISHIAKQDYLIVQLGNQWMMRNRGNEIMRKYYTSSIMRLAAKLKLGCQNVSGEEDNDMDSYLIPKHFETVVKATIACCHGKELDEEDLDSPSNALKLGFDIKRMLYAKTAAAIMANDLGKQKEAKDFLSLMKIEWALKVTKLARVILQQRSFNQEKNLPLPSDLKKLADFLQKELRGLQLDDFTYSNWRKAAVLGLVRITLFNRRRCHEVQAMRLTSYASRTKGVNEISQEMRGELTKFEHQLLERQEVVVIRGKTGRGVPVILPEDVKRLLKFLTDPDARRRVGIQTDNPYVFANNNAGVFRSYDAIREVTQMPEANLQMPCLIRTSNMRKYMATMLQVLDTTESERQWVIDHLGHTMDVHRVHYRQTSDVLERVDVAKLLLIQDMGLVSKFRGKRLQDIQLEEVFLEDPQTDTEASTTSSEIGTLLDLDPEVEPDNEVIPNIPVDNMSDEEDEQENNRKRKRVSGATRQRWSEEEESELLGLFSEDFKINKLPGQKRIESMMRESVKRSGVIHRRKRDTIKKKLSNMMLKRKRVK